MYIFANFAKRKTNKTKNKFKQLYMGVDENKVKGTENGTETSEYLYIFIVLNYNHVACSKQKVNQKRKNPKM